jgi:hypothetical protein
MAQPTEQPAQAPATENSIGSIASAAVSKDAHKVGAIVSDNFSTRPIATAAVTIGGGLAAYRFIGIPMLVMAYGLRVAETWAMNHRSNGQADDPANAVAETLKKWQPMHRLANWASTLVNGTPSSQTPPAHATQGNGAGGTAPPTGVAQDRPAAAEPPRTATTSFQTTNNDAALSRGQLRGNTPTALAAPTATAIQAQSTNARDMAYTPS